MDSIQLISKEQFCIYNDIDISFIDTLNELGLIEIIVQEELHFIPDEQLKSIESYSHMHYDLGINLEGIDAISHLLHRLTSLQEDMIMLRNKLRIYEEELD